MLKTTKCYIRNCSKRWEEDSDKNRQLVTEEDVASVVSMITGIPVQSIRERKQKLSKMRDIYKVIGQDDAVAKIVRYSERTCWYERSKQTYLQWY
jgi:ATP-dependent Clp protease ATP-binding subunit ClpC